MAGNHEHETPFEDPFESKVVKDPFIEDHFSSNQMGGGVPSPNPSAGGQVWSETLPDSTAVLVLGILSIIGAFCYGVVGLILGIIAVSMAGRPERLYQQSPTKYSQASYGNLKAGRVCGIVGLCISGLVLIALLFVFAVAIR